MDRIDYNQTGGFPLSTQILDAAQKAYKTFNQYGYLAGNNLVIITGCTEAAGGTVTDGFVSINGELLPFVGTTATANVIIVETSDSRGFEDGSVKPVIYTRYATFGDGATSYPWANFRRPKTLFELEDRLTQLEMAVPIGLVAIWDRPEDQIPTGWVEHTDLSGKVPAGHLPEDINFGALGGNLGTAQVTLTIDQIPSHKHSSSPWDKFGAKASDVSGETPNAGDYANQQSEYKSNGMSAIDWNNATEKNKGGDQPHTNIQPTRIVKYIRFVGFN